MRSSGKFLLLFLRKQNYLTELLFPETFDSNIVTLR